MDDQTRNNLKINVLVSTTMHLMNVHAPALRNPDSPHFNFGHESHTYIHVYMHISKYSIGKMEHSLKFVVHFVKLLKTLIYCWEKVLFFKM